MKNQTRKPPKSVTLWVDQDTRRPIRISSGAMGDWFANMATCARVRYVPATRGTEAALRIAARELETAVITFAAEGRVYSVERVSLALTRIRKLTGGGK